MDYRQTEFGFLLQLFKGEEIFSSLVQFAKDHNLQSGHISGIGAVKDITVGYFDTEKKGYPKNQFKATHELLSCKGNFSLNEGEPFPHCHIVFCDTEQRAFGGHLFSATVAVTAEFYIVTDNQKVVRNFNDDIGLALWDLDQK